MLELKPGELRLHLRNLYVAPAYSWHQPVELPDGTVLWRSNSRGVSKGHQHRPVLELSPSRAQSHNKESTSSESEYAAGDDREIGVVGHGFASQTSSSVRREQKQEEETENDEERGVEEGECKIDILNNDCLMHIFSFLSKRVRIKIERGMLFQVFSSYMAFIQVISVIFCSLHLRLVCFASNPVSFWVFKF